MTYSIYPKKITEEPLGKKLYRFPKDKELATGDYKALAQLFLKNAQDMVESFQKKDLSRFDALTGNHACQSVAAAVVDCFSDKEVQKELEFLKDSLKRFKQQCNETKLEAAVQEDGYMHFEGFFHKCCPLLALSKKVQFLCFAHLLNTASDNSKIPRQTDLSRLQPLSKRVSQEARETTVLGCRQEVAAYIACYIQEMATSLSDEQLLKNIQIIKEIVPGASSFSQGMGGIMTQATFFAFKAILLKAKEEKTPIVLTQARNDKKPFYLVYQAQGQGILIRKI
ncbi:MAG: hypothetical protein FJZ63_00685 [Chlamydiae bacterium]|nr:hypothetical protein [Chlamydiota bacterium]